MQHVGSLKALDDDRTVALGVGGGERMQDVVALTANLAMQPVHVIHGLLPVVGSFLSPGHHTLGSGQALECDLQGLGVFDELAVRIGDQVGDAAVESDDGLDARRRLRKLELADDRDEPLVTVAADRAAFRFTLERPVHDRAHVAELGKSESISLRAAIPWDAAR